MPSYDLEAFNDEDDDVTLTSKIMHDVIREVIKQTKDKEDKPWFYVDNEFDSCGNSFEEVFNAHQVGVIAPTTFYASIMLSLLHIIIDGDAYPISAIRDENGVKHPTLKQLMNELAENQKERTVHIAKLEKKNKEILDKTPCVLQLCNSERAITAESIKTFLDSHTYKYGELKQGHRVKSGYFVEKTEDED